jgi:hypothetical protein
MSSAKHCHSHAQTLAIWFMIGRLLAQQTITIPDIPNNQLHLLPVGAGGDANWGAHVCEQQHVTMPAAPQLNCLTGHNTVCEGCRIKPWLTNRQDHEPSAWVSMHAAMYACATPQGRHKTHDKEWMLSDMHRCMSLLSNKTKQHTHHARTAACECYKRDGCWDTC